MAVAVEISIEVGHGVRKSCESFGREREEGLRILREFGLSFVFGFCVFFLCLVSKHKKILLNGFM